MTSLPVFYIEETRDDSSKDWHFCITYEDEIYVLHGYRYNYNNSFYTKMTFCDQNVLVKFLRNACCVETSSMDVTMYFVNDKVENFDDIYNSYKYNNELFGYDNFSFTDKSLTDMLDILKDLSIED